MEPSATAYLRALSEAMLGTEVTDQAGDTLSLDEGTERAIDMILGVGASSRKTMLVGNGGSAAIASHLQSDLCKTAGVRALVFTEQPLLTALSNDLGYEQAYEWQVKIWAEPGDLLVAISSSGQSENIVRAARAAVERGCSLMTLTGFRPDNPLRQMGNLSFYVSSAIYGYVEAAHTALAHCLAERARDVGKSRSETRAKV